MPLFAPGCILAGSFLRWVKTGPGWRSCNIVAASEEFGMRHTFLLPESRTHKVRRFTLIPAARELVDAYLTIEMGEVGPKGGTSKHKVESYFVQEIDPDYGENPAERLFILVKDRPVPPADEFTFDPDDESAEPYAVCVRRDRLWSGWCTCKGNRCTGDCKHREALAYAVGVLGWGE